FNAVAYDVYDNVIPGVDFIWTTDIGSVDATGFFTAQTTVATGTVTATNGTVSYSATVNLKPGALDHIIVTPDPVTVVVGETQLFSAIAYDVYNNVISGVDFVWTTDVGSIDATGFFTAQTLPGAGTVTATNGTVNGSANVTVIVGAIDHIVVTPDPATVIVGDTQLFTATAYDQFNNVIPGVDFVWTTNVGLVDVTGLFTAQTTPAVGTVTATNGTINNSASVTVIPGPVDHIIVIPDPVTVTVGDTQIFTATAYDVYNNLIPGVDFTWSTDVGSVDATGNFTAQTTPGVGVVAATNGTVSGSANVTVIPGALDHIIVTPDPVTIIVNGVLQFNAVAYDVYDNVIPGVGFVWTTDVGSVDATGLFTAQSTSALGSVTATNGTVSGSATVDVVDVTIDHIIVLPNPATVVVGGSQQFTATAYDQFNNLIVGVVFVWTTDVGSVDATGFFTAQTIPGAGTVTATNGMVNGSANVTVIVGAIDHIVVTPDPANLTVGESLQFSAQAFDVYNNLITNATFTWSTNVGSVNSTGFFTAQTVPALGWVNATSGTVTGTAAIEVVVGAIDHIIVIPDPVTLTVGGAQVFNATAYDVYNNIIPGVEFVWTTDVGSVDATGLFTAQTTPGSGTVTATNGTVSGSANVVVVVGPIDH
ncbi:MAG: Ig-like domain-containing protein, partial [Thermoplasmata archaeon]|nr:Ig-like domain-containing protein [Thermoplasmata archaeon]